MPLAKPPKIQRAKSVPISSRCFKEIQEALRTSLPLESYSGEREAQRSQSSEVVEDPKECRLLGGNQSKVSKESDRPKKARRLETIVDDGSRSNHVNSSKAHSSLLYTIADENYQTNHILKVMSTSTFPKVTHDFP